MEELTIFEAAHILGTTPADAKVILGRRRCTTESVEGLAVQHYRWRQHTENAESYWVTVSRAAEILEVSPQRVKQLLDADLLPYLTTPTRVRLMRRAQLETIANARLSRRLREDP